MNKYLLYLIFFLVFFQKVNAQKDTTTFRLSVQTDLLAYTTKGGYSIWTVARHHQNQIALAFVNFPNRNKDYSLSNGIQDDDRFFRLGLHRYWGKKKMKNFFYGINVEYHLRTLTEEGNSQILKDNNFQFAPILGYNWYPFKNKTNGIKNLSIMLWAGPRFRPNYYKQDRIFENTGGVYPIPDFINAAFGINISYTLIKK